MENTNFIEKIASGLSQSATVKNVYGEPIQVGDKTIIPVAKIAYGFGGGYGKGNHGKPGGTSATATEKSPSGEGAGSGGGLYAMPKGVYEVTSAGTTFIPANSKGQLLVGMAIGFLIKALFFSGHRRK